MLNLKSKILIIIGPTSSGKSELAVKLAKKHNGEIVSCDSRQVYKGMDIGTGKVKGKWHGTLFDGRQSMSYIYKSIPHHCIDFQNPARQLSAARFKVLAQRAIKDILRRGKLPILCGGTAHWIDAVVFDQHFPEVKPNPKLRKELEKKSADELFVQLQKLDPARAQTIDRHNKRRLIRALEIVISTGQPVPLLSGTLSGVIQRMTESKGPELKIKDSSSAKATKDKEGLRIYNPLWIGINPPKDILYSKIKKRLLARLKQGMVKEVAGLHSPPNLKYQIKNLKSPQVLSWKKLESFGLEYKFVSLYLQEKLSYDEMIEQLYLAITHYTKRQMTWWKKNKDIHWVDDPKKALSVIK